MSTYQSIFSSELEERIEMLAKTRRQILATENLQLDTKTARELHEIELEIVRLRERAIDARMYD